VRKLFWLSASVRKSKKERRTDTVGPHVQPTHLLRPQTQGNEGLGECGVGGGKDSGNKSRVAQDGVESSRLESGSQEGEVGVATDNAED